MGDNPYESLTFGNSLSLRVDGAIGTMSLSPNGRDAVLAGRKGLFVIDLEDPFTAPRWLHHITSWEVADVQWSPHHFLKPSWCISTSNQKALLWDLARPSNNAIAHVLHRHTRAITDINFHPMDPEILATCSIDTFVYSWDMRSPRRPIGKWAEWRAGATQVKWSHNNPHQLVSSHDHSFFLWDSRKGASPVLRIDNAHRGKINGLDFSSADKLITCSNDERLKIWDLLQLLNGENQPSVIMQADYPIARARSLPFGKDGCCGIMPLRGGGNAIHVINYQAALNENAATGETVLVDVIPDYSFRGHQGSIKDFLWRTLRSSYAGFDSKQPWEDYQLVSWSSQDYDLKLWPHEREIYEVANYNPLHQKLFNSLVKSAGGSDSEDGIAGNSPTGSPGFELNEETSLKKSATYVYNSYCAEPPLRVEDYSREYNGDYLSSMAYFKIVQSQENFGGSTQVNHLDWISGVRMGESGTNRQEAHSHSAFGNSLGPSNLGEEVSIVGHKFPKLRFEKISVSTGHLVMTLKGPLPKVEDVVPEDGNGKENTTEKSNAISEDKLSTSASKRKATGRDGSPLLQASGPSATLQLVSVGKSPPSSVINTKEIESQRIDNIDAMEDNSKMEQEQSLAFIRLEVIFPKCYPDLEDTLSKGQRGKRAHKSRTNKITFNIEETHEITPDIKRIMIDGLKRIAEFYSNKFSRFCLEPCLRFLMGDRINLDEASMVQELDEIQESALGEEDDLVEVGSEGWADDLVSQHNAATTMPLSYGSVEEEEDEDADLIPTIGDHGVNALESSQKEDSKPISFADQLRERIKYDTTPLPKGCGAVWSQGGRLVCFFIKRHNEEQEKRTQDSTKSTSYGTGVSYDEDDANIDQLETGSVDSMDAEVSLMDDSDGQMDENIPLDSSLSSDDSFNHDWDELLENDIPSRSRVRGLFKESMKVGGNFFGINEHKSGTGMTPSAAGTASNYKSSTHGDQSIKGKRTDKTSKGSFNVVSVVDFSHLTPDKFELASSYKVLGDSPERLARHNSEVALYYGYMELRDAWKLIELILIKDVTSADLRIARSFASPDSCKFFWGNHPFGNKWLIKELFHYFELKLDLQMVVMMSCILYENITTPSNRAGDFLQNTPIGPPFSTVLTSNDRRNDGISGTLNECEIKVGSPFSFQQANTEKLLLRKASMMSSDANMHRISDYQMSRPPSLTVTLPHPTSVSPEFSPHQGAQRRNQNIESPQRRLKHYQKRPLKGQQLKTGSSLLPAIKHKSGLRPAPTITIAMKNDDRLDIFEDLFTSPLLDEVSTEKIRRYREEYASMLYAWDLLYNRLEILKFNYTADDSEESKAFEEFRCDFGLRFRKALNVSQLLLSPITTILSAKRNSWNTRKRNQLQNCALCAILITKRAFVCASCEHVLHPECALEWWSAGEVNLECPTGCGCSCLKHGI